MGGEIGPMERNTAEFIRQKLYQDGFFQLKHQPFQFWCNFGVAPLTQASRSTKSHRGFGAWPAQRGHWKLFFSFISLFSPKLSVSQLPLAHENVEYLNPHLSNK